MPFIFTATVKVSIYYVIIRVFIEQVDCCFKAIKKQTIIGTHQQKLYMYSKQTVGWAMLLFSSVLLQYCKEDVERSFCFEGTLLGPVCPAGAGYVGDLIQVSDSIFGALPHYDTTATKVYLLAALNLPQAYQTQVGQTIYFTARAATQEEISEDSPKTANCVQPPLIMLTSVQSSCLADDE